MYKFVDYSQNTSSNSGWIDGPDYSRADGFEHLREAAHGHGAVGGRARAFRVLEDVRQEDVERFRERWADDLTKPRFKDETRRRRQTQKGTDRREQTTATANSNRGSQHTSSGHVRACLLSPLLCSAPSTRQATHKKNWCTNNMYFAYSQKLCADVGGPVSPSPTCHLSCTANQLNTDKH